MDTITIEIPDGLSPQRKAELTAWLEHQVQQVTPERLPCEDDPEWRAEVSRKLTRAEQDIEAGRCVSRDEARRRLDALVYIDKPA